MTTLETAWQAFLAAVAEARELHAAGAGTEILQGPIRRARELPAVIDDELAANQLVMPDETRNALERAELAEVNSSPVTGVPQFMPAEVLDTSTLQRAHQSQGVSASKGLSLMREHLSIA